MRPTLSAFSFHVRGRKSGLKKTLVLISCTNSEALVGYWDVEDPVFSGDKPKKNILYFIHYPVSRFKLLESSHLPSLKGATHALKA